MLPHIREAVKEDSIVLKELAIEFASGNPSDSTTAVDDLQQSDNALEQLLNTEHVKIFIAEHLGFVVGCIIFSWFPSLVHGGRLLVFVDLIIVKKDFRRRGIGKQLMNTAILFARCKKAYKIVLTAREDNTAVIAFHRHCGLENNGLAFALYTK